MSGRIERGIAALLRLADSVWGRTAAPILIAIVALSALHLMSRQVHLADIRHDLTAVPVGRLALALAGVAISYAALAMYDVLAVRRLVPGRVRLPVAAAAGAAGYAVSNLLGASYLTGTAVRYRIYGGAGLELGVVLGIIATSWSAFWMAALLLLGGLMVLHPAGLAAQLPIGPGTETAVGLLLLVALAMFLGWLAWRPRGVTVAGVRHPLPDLRGALALLAVAVVDIVGAALVLWALMPPDAVPNVAVFFAVFIGAITLGILSHSPGGLGVFEAAVVAGLGASGRPDELAALVLYRLIYGVLPFLVAATGLAVLWVAGHRRRLTQGGTGISRALAPLVPPVSAGIALVAGLVLLLSGSLPFDPASLPVLEGVVPLAVLEVSHLVGSVAGVLLLIVARGLGRRLARAWVVAMGLLATGLVASLVNGLGWRAAGAMAFAMVVLWLFRDAFHRRRDRAVLRLDTAWLATVAGLLLPVVWLGLVAYRHVEYRDALWWQFAWDGDASRFLRATLAIAVVVLAVAFDTLLSARAPRVRASGIPQVVIDLLSRSRSAEAQIALSGDKSFLLDPGGRAYLAYADTGRLLVALGDPVGDDAEAARGLIWTFRELADRTGRRCAFYRVGSEFLPTYLDLGLSVLKMGEVARVPLTEFSLEGSKRRDLRQAVAKAGREGFVFEILKRAEVPAAFGALKAVSDAWLATRNGAEKGFSLGACTPDYLARFDIALLREAATGRIVAFANIMEGADREELSIDLMRHDDGCPRYGMEALFGFLMLHGRDAGFRWFSLGAAPLSGLENRRFASVWNRVGGFVHDHGERFYRFEGLRAFKQKFDPVWSPEYLACPGGLAVPRVLFEIGTLISKGVGGLVK